MQYKPKAKYWKYRDFSDRNIENLRNKQLWYSNPKEFNDYFDNSIDKDYIFDYFLNYLEGNKTTILNKINNNNHKKSFCRNLKDAKQGLFADYFASWYSYPLLEKQAHCCFCKNHLNEQMWAMYAGNNTGFALGFEKLDITANNTQLSITEENVIILALSFNQYKKTMKNYPAHIIFSSYITDIQKFCNKMQHITKEVGVIKDIIYFDNWNEKVDGIIKELTNCLIENINNDVYDLINPKFDNCLSKLNQYISTFKTLKKSSWAYEEETRIIANLNSTEYDETGKLFNFETTELTDIIFGINCSLENKNKIINICNNNNLSNIEFWDIYEEKSQFLCKTI